MSQTHLRNINTYRTNGKKQQHYLVKICLLKSPCRQRLAGCVSVTSRTAACSTSVDAPDTVSARALGPAADSQWSKLLPSCCPSCRAAIASLKCSFRLWISRSLRPFIPLSSSCISAYRSQARRFSCGAAHKLSMNSPL